MISRVAAGPVQGDAGGKRVHGSQGERCGVAGVGLLSLMWVGLLCSAPLAGGSSPLPLVLQSAAAVIYRAGAVVCHQRPERSFALRAVPLPVCGRCLGLYLGAPMGLLVVAVRRRRPAPAVRLLRGAFAAALLPSLGLVILEAAGTLDPGNAVRAIGAVPAGIATGWVTGLGARLVLAARGVG